MFGLWSQPKPVEIVHSNAESLPEPDPPLKLIYVHPNYVEPFPIQRPLPKEPEPEPEPEPKQVIDNVHICEMNSFYCCFYCCAHREFFGQYQNGYLDMICSYVFSPNGQTYIGYFTQEPGKEWEIDHDILDPQYKYCFYCHLCNLICYSICYEEYCLRHCCGYKAEYSAEHRRIVWVVDRTR